MKEWFTRRATLFRQFDARTNGIPGILSSALKKFNAAQAGEAAASLAYYALFSVVPLLIVFVAVAIPILGEDKTVTLLAGLLGENVPMTEEQIASLLAQIVPQSSLTILAACSLLWAGSGVFGAIVHNIDRAWMDSGASGVVRRHLLALLLTGALLAMLILSAYVNVAIGLLWGMQELFPRVHQIMLRLPAPALTRATSFVIEFALLLLLYWRVPRVAVWPTAAVWGAALGSMCRANPFLGLCLVPR